MEHGSDEQFTPENVESLDVDPNTIIQEVPVSETTQASSDGVIDEADLPVAEIGLEKEASAIKLVQPEIGIKTGSQFFDSLLAATGLVPSQELRDLFKELQSAMPQSHKLNSFDSGQQGAIMKVAAQVCNDFMDDEALRAAFFPGLDFTVQVSALSPDQKNSIADALKKGFWGPSASTGEMSDIVGLMDLLITGMQNPAQGDGTLRVVKGTCAAVAGSFSALVL